MPVGFVIIAFFVGGFLGSITMALACSAHSGEEFFESMRDDELGVPLPMSDRSKWN
jgi:hypothetical protein